MKSSLNKITAFAISLLAAFGFAACCLKIPALSSIIESKGNINILTYGATILLFCFFFLFLYGILNSRTSQTMPSPSFAIGTSILLLIGSIVFLLFMFQLEGNIYGGATTRYIWHKLPFWLVVLFLTAEIVFFFFCYKGSSLKLPDAALYILYGSLALLICFTYYTPAAFHGNSSSRLHIDAYFNSIYNVLHGSPYSEYVTSIYGHYGILYKLPLKILGGDFVDFVLLNAVLGALSFLAMFLCLHFMVKNNLLRILGCISMTFPYLTMRSGIYWQVWPHRILFMSLMLFFAAACVHFKKRNAVTCILGYLLSMLGILWNTESGLFCAIAWAGFWILRILCQKRNRFRKILLSGALHLISVVLCFLGAYGIVGIYNICHGGTFNTISEFLFPLLTKSYMDDWLRVDLPLYPSAYMPAIALFLLSAAWGISHMKFFHKNETAANISVPCFAFFTSVLSLGQMTYFANRAAYHNLDICHLPAILMTCMLAEPGMRFLKQFQLKKCTDYHPLQIYRGTFTALSLAMLVTITTGTVIQYGDTADLKLAFHNEQENRDFAAQIVANVPENTYAFGIGIPELYAMLRWDTQCYTLDFADISVYPPAADYVIEDIRQKEIPSFLVGEGTVKRLRKFAADNNEWIESNYTITKEFEVQGAIFYYFEKNKS